LKKQYLQIKDQKNVLDFIDSRKRGILLEIGAYAGNFCNEAQKRNWDIIGIEPFALPALYAKRTFNLDLINTPFEKCNLKPDSLAVVVSFHVIEHIYNPKDFVSKAYKLLAKDGLLILETPTYDSMSFKILKHRERSVRCEGHLYFFTKKSLGKLVESCGFKIIKHETVGRTLTLGRLLTNIGIILGTKNKFSNFIQKFHLENIKLTLNMGDMQRIYCEKC
jgi:2-polyprenyl-3-methyl-5-hydroxy-6-metoxy-1,4-benzoquinol methylase